MKKPIAWLSGKSQETSEEYFISRNPSKLSDEIAVFGIASKEQARAACEKAQIAFSKWRKTPAPVRASVIKNFAELLTKNKNQLATLMTREMGKPFKEALGDVQEAIDTCYFFISEGRRLYGMTVPSEMPNKELYTYRRPIGVFGCITAGNFPVAVPSWYFVPALICGNTCVWKCSEDAPLTSYYFTQLLYHAGCPDGVFHTLFGGGQDATGQWLVELIDEGMIDKFGFTGSTRVGQQIGEICGRNLVSACLELGGKNPLVILEDADLDLALKGVIWSGFATAGQRCTSLGNLILQESIYHAFIERLSGKLVQLKIGDPMHSDTLYGPLISEKFFDNHLKHVNHLIAPHHEIVTFPNGQITQTAPWPNWVGDLDPDEGLFCFPTIVAGVLPADDIYAQETFGPLFNIMKAYDIDEAIQLANCTGYGLSSAIYTKNIDFIHHWKENIQAGMTSINNSTVGAEAHLPFGGTQRSGNGSRQSGVWVIDQFTQWQAVNMDFSGHLQKAQMDTAYIKASIDYTINHEKIK